MLLVPCLGLDAGPYPFTPPLDDAVLTDLRWYLEQYPHWPSGPDFQRAANLEGQLEDWGRVLFDAAFASRDALRLWQQFRDHDGDRLVTLDAFPGHWANLQGTWGGIVQAVVAAARGGDVSQELAELLTRMSHSDYRNLATALQAFLQGARDIEQMVDSHNLDSEDYLIIRKTLDIVEHL